MKVRLFDLAFENHSFSRLTLIEKEYISSMAMWYKIILVPLLALAVIFAVYNWLVQYGFIEKAEEIIHLFGFPALFLMGCGAGLSVVGQHIEMALKRAKKVYTDTLLEKENE